MFLMAALLLTYPLMMMLAPIAPGTTVTVLAFVKKKTFLFLLQNSHSRTRNTVLLSPVCYSV